MLNLEFRVGGDRKYTITENTSFFYHGTNRKDAVVTAHITGFLPHQISSAVSYETDS